MKWFYRILNFIKTHQSVFYVVAYIVLLIFTMYFGRIFYDYISNAVYYLWDKTKDAFTMTVITLLLRRLYCNKYIIRISWASTAFSISRVLIEYLIILFPSLDHPATSDFLFCLNWAVVMYVLFYDWITKMFFKIRVYWGCLIFWFKHKQKA